VTLRLFLGTLDVALFVGVDVAGLLDLLATARGFDELLRRFALVAIGALVAFAFVVLSVVTWCRAHRALLLVVSGES